MVFAVNLQCILETDHSLSMNSQPQLTVNGSSVIMFHSYPVFIHVLGIDYQVESLLSKHFHSLCEGQRKSFVLFGYTKVRARKK